MFDLPDDQKYSFEIQQKFEIDLINKEYEENKVFDPAFLISQFEISGVHSEKILSCAFRKGLLIRDSAGKFVRNIPSEPKITSVFQYAEKSGLRPTSIVRSVDLISASELVSKKLDLDPGIPIYVQKRSRLINESVVANQYNYIPFCITPDLHSLDLRQHSFQVILENKYHAVVHSIREEYKLANPTEEDQQILGLERGEEIVLVQRLSLSATDQPLVWADIHINPKHFHLVESLWPEAASLLRSSRG